MVEDFQPPTRAHIGPDTTLTIIGQLISQILHMLASGDESVNTVPKALQHCNQLEKYTTSVTQGRFGQVADIEFMRVAFSHQQQQQEHNNLKIALSSMNSHRFNNNAIVSMS